MFLMSYVLIVDDDQDARELLEEIAHSLGLETRSAADGLEALDVLRHIDHTPPRLIMLDLMMPSMDGFAVYTWLRGNPMTRRVPVIVVTAVARDQVDMLRLPGVSEVVQKGQFTVSVMSELITSVLAPPDGAASKLGY